VKVDSHQLSCDRHDDQEFAIACIHVCCAIDSGADVGFFSSTESSGPWPDAWCSASEQWSVEHPNATADEWMMIANFKLLCVQCWDEAKRALDFRD
jgi:hypothetical protein